MSEATAKANSNRSNRSSDFMRNAFDGFGVKRFKKKVGEVYSRKASSSRVLKEKFDALKNTKLMFVEARMLKEMCEPSALGKKTVSLREQIAFGKYGKVYVAVDNRKQKQTQNQKPANISTKSNANRKLFSLKTKLNFNLKTVSRSNSKSKADKVQNHNHENEEPASELKAEKKMYAVKRIRIGKKGSRAAPELVMEELNLIRQLQDCPYIVRYHGCYLNYFPTQYLCLVMEYANRGDARKIIHDPSTQQQQQCVAASILLALDYMHSRGYVHKDIKPENMLLADEVTEERMIVKLCDFGASERYDDGSQLRHWYGTMQYLAPEYLEFCVCKDFALDHNKPDNWGVSKNPKYFQSLCTDRMDIWALGIFMMEILMKSSSSAKMNRSMLTAVIRKLFRYEGNENALDVLFFRKQENASSSPSPIQGDDGEIISPPPSIIQGDDGNMTPCPQIEDGVKVQGKKTMKQLKYKEKRKKLKTKKAYSDAELEVGLWKPHQRKIVEENVTMVDFISKCLVLNPQERWSADQLLKHPFVADMARELSPNM
uniref:Protein kinase domain-containing protein n=1 Tax=Aplanochytrium stocchinoi TaxID=215587 RepID=A0A7S3V210_9STRA|mmetsp:Transcript_18683/g.22918  ORF Transcript_18683/g.22918 Transcript_18683/m.22918 type:complete len:543 (+) Transcript_18683:251-1879(+)|eukprot:CAMPEP_0204833414 /NCGR_PEP_ID=MMETSP1346-20131115/16758_1 /ASSEMBLY_ACC=CAM_ASM_000771 /TAXON_ID=215587 /ORGANISM="Aplanochytrium stocchinoi, Strain GSBS06" /LENGTH=542 /DNA_ID=CAMNT_0051965935 /DNA_START=191 /DNA_END=1819 /DNA_ORIENTATION=-